MTGMLVCTTSCQGVSLNAAVGSVDNKNDEVYKHIKKRILNFKKMII